MPAVEDMDDWDYVRVRIARLQAVFSGIVTGTLFALGILIATNWLVVKGGDRVGPHLSLLGQYFIGYRVSFVGSIIGAAYAFVLGFGCGYSVASMYNWLAGWRETKNEQTGSK